MYTKKYIFSAIVTATALLLACKKDIKPVAESVNIENKAFVKIVHAAPSFRALFNVRDSFNVFANNQKLNATFLTYGGAFPAANIGYAAVDPGTVNFRLFLPGGITKPDSVEITSITKTLSPNKYYSFIITDQVRSTRDSSQIWIEDNFETPPPNFYSMRFVHAVLNDTAGRNVDIYSARRNAAIYTNIRPGQTTTFTNFPFTAGITDTLIVRRAGTTFELSRLNAVGFAHQRVFTLLYRGHGDSTLTARRAGRTLLTYLNQ